MGNAIFLKTHFLFWRERNGEGDRRNIDVRVEHPLVASCMRPDQELVQQPFGAWKDAQPSHTGQGDKAVFLFYVLCLFLLFKHKCNLLLFCLNQLLNLDYYWIF